MAVRGAGGIGYHRGMLRRFGPAILLFLLLPCLPASAGRQEFLDVKKRLEDVYFDELAPVERDELFRALGSYDDPSVIPTIAEAAAAFGTYLAGLEGGMAALQAKLEPYTKRSALTDVEVGLRNSYIRRLEKKEAEWTRAQSSARTLAGALAGLKSPDTLRVAVRKLARHDNPRVRHFFAAAAPLWHKRLGSEEWSMELLDVLERMARDEETGVRVEAARAAAAFKREEGLALLEKFLRDGDWRVRAAAIRSLKAHGGNKVVGILIAQMKKEDGRLLDDISAILQEWTGKRMQFADVWQKWWDSVGHKVPPKKDPGKEATLKARDSAAFYGIPTRSDRICFVIDVSGSMNKEVEQIKHRTVTGPGRASERPVEGKTRFDVARNELKRAVGKLNRKKRFSVIYFNQAAKLWRPEMEKATRGNKKALRKDVEAWRASGATYTMGALRQAFKMAGVIHGGAAKKSKDGAAIDTIFVLSDGGPTTNKLEEPKPMDPGIILEKVREWNRDAGIVIHCIAVHCDEVGTYFLRSLAEQNGGVFVERKK